VARTILLVDDDPLVLTVLSDMFEILGCTVVTAHSAAEAMVLLSENPAIDTLVTDVNMPVVSGVELAQHVQEIRKEVKTLLISGRESDGHGFPILRKPFDLGALVRTMEQTTGLC
jgi:CheY-like chemotaxis protein